MKVCRIAVKTRQERSAARRNQKELNHGFHRFHG
jgi:hypothetical protein